MSETNPGINENETAVYSAFRVNLESRISAWESDKRSGIKGSENSFGSFELGKSVDDVLDLIKTSALSGKPQSLILLGDYYFWKHGTAADRILKRVPPFVREKGFDPITIKKLAERLRLLYRSTSDTVISSREPYPAEKEGAEVETIYNILPIKADGIPGQVYWHELVRGFLDTGNPSSVMVTVNKQYIPTNSSSTLLNRLILRVQGI